MHLRCDMRFENGKKKVLQKAGSKPVLCPILTPARLLPPSIRVRCGGGVRIGQYHRDFNERGK